MITTLSLNPSLDYIVDIDQFKAGKINRTHSEYILPGGKGINVSQVLNNLGMESTALGFVAGFTGDELIRILDSKGIKSKMIKVDGGMTRINTKVRSDEETAINGMGPSVTESDLEKIVEELKKLKVGDMLVLSGNIARDMSKDTYKRIMERVSSEVNVVVDATKEQLLSVAEHSPFLIKPNHEELGELFDVEVKDKQDAVKYGKLLQERGFRNILVSMGGEGAVLLTEDGLQYAAKPPAGKLVNSVGAGDSMVAGFIYGYIKFGNFKDAFKYGLASGSASAFSEQLGTKEEIEALLNQINIEEVK